MRPVVMKGSRRGGGSTEIRAVVHLSAVVKEVRRDPAQGSIEVFGPARDDLVRRRVGVTATFAQRCVE